MKALTSIFVSGHLTVVSIVLLILIIPFPILPEHRWILTSISGVLIFSLNTNKVGSIVFPWAIKFLLVYLFWAFLSLFWVESISMALYPINIWINLLLAIFAGYLFIEKHGIELVEPGIFALSLLIIGYVLLAFAGELLFARDILPTGYNKHYNAVLLSGLTPFVIINHRKWIKPLVKGLISFIVIAYVFFTRSKGVLISLVCIFAIYNFIKIDFAELKRRWTLHGFKIASFIFISLVILLAYAIFMVAEWDNNDLARLLQYQESLRLAVESRFLGVGLGNWFMEAYDIDMSAAVGYNHSSFHRLLNHSLYSLILAELGIVGLLLYSLFCGNIIFSNLRNFRKLGLFYRACFISILLYFISSIFYLSVFSYEGHFSGIQLFAFFLIGFLCHAMNNHSVVE